MQWRRRPGRELGEVFGSDGFFGGCPVEIAKKGSQKENEPLLFFLI